MYMYSKCKENINFLLMVTPHDIFCVTTQKRRVCVCTEYKLVSGRVQQWLLIEETTVWMRRHDEELCSVCLLMMRRRRIRRKVTFSTLFHNDLFDAASFQLCWCNPACLHQPLFIIIIIIIITWALKQHRFWLNRKFLTFSHTCPDKPRGRKVFFLLRWSTFVKEDTQAAPSQYHRTPRNQDSVCRNTMVRLDRLQEELGLRPVFLLSLNHSFSRILFIYYPGQLTCHFHITLPLYVWPWVVYYCSQCV